MKKPKTQSRETLAITMQYHAGRGTIYELEGHGDKLSVRVSPRETETDAGDWRIEAAAVHGPADVTIVEWGPTRAETLMEVGSTWRSQGPSLGLPSFDWNEVARLLTVVSAI